MFGAIAEAKHMCEALSTPVLEQTAAWPATGKTFRGLETLLSNRRRDFPGYPNG